MIGVITGDIIESRKSKTPKIWLTNLTESLSRVSTNDKNWELYRGDSFQIEFENPQDAFLNAVYIKSCIKTIKNMDVRLAIGIGHKTYHGSNVSESNGEVFQFSGETLEALKKEKLSLKIKTPNTVLDTELNLYFKLALISMDHWTANSAEVVKVSIENPELQQKELGNLIGINQNAVSYRLKRANFNEIMELDRMFRNKIETLIA